MSRIKEKAVFIGFTWERLDASKILQELEPYSAKTAKTQIWLIGCLTHKCELF